MRRVILTLTEAQAALLRGGLRSHMEDMSIAGLWTDTDVRMAEDILRQLNKPAKEVK